MFDRSAESYCIDSIAVDRILADESNPLCVISKLIPERSKVLDVGAGNGVLSLLLARLHKEIEIHGIEPTAAAAELAASHYDTFIHGTLDSVTESRGCVSDNTSNYALYDYIVLADVIEHTINPVALLRQASRLLAQNGRILVSVPNIAFAPIRAALMAGEWEYTDWGIIERTHLRFFSKKGLLSCLHSASLRPEKLFHLGRSPFRMEKQLQDYKLDLLSLQRLKRDPLSFTYQLLAVCLLDDRPDRQLVTEEAWIGISRRDFIRQYFRLRHQKTVGN